MQRIEKDLGAEVFDRSTRPLTLTESGRIFFEAEKRVMEIREDCRRAVADIHGGERGRVVIGASEYREMFFLTEVLPVFSAAHPRIEIALEEGTTRELEDFVWTGKTDLSLVIAPLAQSGLEAVEIYEERLLLAVNEKSPLIEKARTLCPEERREDEFPPFSFRLLADEPFLVVREGQQIHDLYRPGARGRGFGRDDRHRNARETKHRGKARAVFLDRPRGPRSEGRGGLSSGTLFVEGRAPSHPDHAGRGAGEVLPRVRRKAFPRARALPGAKRAPENPDARIA